jgi:hypothetical protein
MTGDFTSAPGGRQRVGATARADRYDQGLAVATVLRRRPSMIEFPTVSHEFHSLIDRRRELFTFLGSVFAGMGLFLQNVIQGHLPPSLRSLETHIFAFYALVLMAASMNLSLRMARLHGGLVLNGVLFARLMEHQDFTRKGNPARSASHNVFGVSFLQFLLVDLIAGFSALVLALAVSAPGAVAAALGGFVFVLWLGLYIRFHDKAAAVAFHKIATEECAPFDRAAWEAHTSESLEGTNKDMLAALGFVGLMLFSTLEILSGLGAIHLGQSDLSSESIITQGPLIYTALMLVTCLLQLVAYIRLRVAVGKMSLELDPTDRPFRPFRLTDSYLGYLLVAFLTAVSAHLFLVELVPAWQQDFRPLLVCDALILAVVVVIEPAVLAVAGRVYGRPPARKPT